MKKIKKVELSHDCVMSSLEMKNLQGGTTTTSSTNCSLTCPNGSSISITSCIGTCTAGGNTVTCSGPTSVLTKFCK